MATPATADLPQSASIVSRWLLTEASGNRSDSVGSNTLTDNNTVLSGDGYSGSIYDYVTSADFEADNVESLSIVDASQSGLDITGNLTISMWVKFESLPASSAGMILAAKYDDTGNNRSWLVALNNNAGTYRLQWRNTSDGTNTTGTNAFVNWVVSTGVWYHLVFVYTASLGAVDFYVNGLQQGVRQTGQATSIYSGAAVFYLGRNSNADNYYDGLMQDVCIWSRALTDAEVDSLA